MKKRVAGLHIVNLFKHSINEANNLTFSKFVQVSHCIFAGKMKLLILARALALIASSQAGLRFGCSSLSIQRINPLVGPGNVPSAHLHQIVDGNVFAPVMNSSAMDFGNKGTCTICFFSQDFSNYWTAVL
jgi:hypothetical protein